MAEKIFVNNYIILKDRMYTKTHEWAKETGDLVTVGITDYAQKKLRDIVGVELPEIGTKAKRGEAVASIESVKAVADVYAPVSGEIVEVNERLYEEPELLNKDPYGDGWMFKMKPSNPSELKSLLSPEAYAEKIKEEEEH